MVHYWEQRGRYSAVPLCPQMSKMDIGPSLNGTRSKSYDAPVRSLGAGQCDGASSSFFLVALIPG